MRTLVESLRRLYKADSPLVTLSKLDVFLTESYLTYEEYTYIITKG